MYGCSNFFTIKIETSVNPITNFLRLPSIYLIFLISPYTVSLTRKSTVQALLCFFIILIKLLATESSLETSTLHCLLTEEIFELHNLLIFQIANTYFL